MKDKCPMIFSRSGNSSTDCIEEKCAWWVSADLTDEHGHIFERGFQCAVTMTGNVSKQK